MEANAGSAATAIAESVAADTAYYTYMAPAGTIVLMAKANDAKSAWDLMKPTSVTDVYRAVGSVAVGVAVTAAFIGTGPLTVTAVAAGLAAGEILDLMDAPFRRTFADAVTLTAAARAVPDMQGSGWVRDLREAMSLANGVTGTPSADLVAAVTSFGAGTTRTAQRHNVDDPDGKLDAIVEAWAATTGRLGGGGFTSGHAVSPPAGVGTYVIIDLAPAAGLALPC
ncbi:MAG: hypothetical protein JNM90_22285 [Burkholderiales bacterium]|nr:hypothetical protein [Burkholderiales bacterium]